MKAYLNKSDHEKYFGKEKGVCVMNHSYENDWLLGFMYNNKMNILGVSLLRFMTMLVVTFT